MNKIYIGVMRSSLIGFLLLLSSATAVSQTVDFSPNPDSQIVAIATQADGKILIGGSFNLVDRVNRRALARIDANGSLDASFNADVALSGNVTSIAVQDDGKILIAGSFTTLGGSDGFIRNRIARLNTDGSVDTSFNPDANAAVSRVFLQSDGKILINGGFTTIGGVPVGQFVRLNSDGAIDASFDVAQNSFQPSALHQLPDGKLLVGGLMTVNGAMREGVTRLNVDGSIDTTLVSPNVSGRISDLVVQDDGKIIIGGFITSVGDRVRSNIVRLNSDGSLDIDFNPIVSSSIRTLALQNDGKVILGGFFREIDSIVRNKIARLNTDGSVDESFAVDISAQFNPSLTNNAFVSELLIQDDGRILVGGSFVKAGSFSRDNLVRLNIDGSVDGVEQNLCFPVTAANGVVSTICL